MAAASVHLLLPLPLSKPFDQPAAANLSTLWTLNSSLTLNSDGSTILPLLASARISFDLIFVFGFFCYVPCSAFLLSIYIVHTKLFYAVSPRVVWSANRDLPVHLNATLLFSSDGDLILRDADGSFVWSSANTSGGHDDAETLNLLGSGNLVVLDREGGQLWASFDHPTDSWLIGHSLRQGQRLTANSSPANTTRGQFYLEFLDVGLRAFVASNPPQLYFKRMADGLPKPQNRSAIAATFVNGSLAVVGEPFLSIGLNKGSPFQFLRLEDDGHFRHYDWQSGWNVLGDAFLVRLPDDDGCAYPTVCGRYGICSKGQCSCPQGVDGGSDYFKPVDSREINLGCSAVIQISCGSIERHQLLALDQVSYFNYVDRYAIVLDRIDVETCKQACLRNCSCKAALFRYAGNTSSGSCFLPSQIFSLMDDKPKNTLYNSIAFIKVQTALSATPPKSPIVDSGASPGTTSIQSWRKKLVIGLVSGFVLAGLFVAFIIIYVRRGVKQLEEEDQFDEISGMLSRFSYEELKSATKNFEEKLGKGGFGTVFKGTLSNGTNIAVKRLDGVGQGKKEFLAEVETIGNIHHINLVSLVGFCVEKSHKLLVMEYMPNGSLDTWIFGKTKDTSLNWQTRFNIIINIAKGLSYLHEDCKQKIAHLDIKPQNILLDEKFNAKVADFGLSKLIDRDQSKIMTKMRGTPGYLAPEWLSSIITEKVDVYSFGVVVLEIVCGRKNIEPLLNEEEVVNLIGLIQEKLRDDLLVDLFDKNSNDIQIHKEEAIEMMRLAIWCLQSDYNRRPSMSMVVKVLEGSSNVDVNMDFDLLGSNFGHPIMPVPILSSLIDHNELSSELTGR